MLNRHLSSVYRALQARNITEDEYDYDCEQHAREQQPVLRVLVEKRWLLEDTQTARARCEEVEELPVGRSAY